MKVCKKYYFYKKHFIVKKFYFKYSKFEMSVN